ncbi:MAG: Sec-independent protein translocase protein TatB [Pseudomonadota bacterium]
MFDLGWAEMGVIMLVALIVLGPKELPRLARDIGRWTGKARAMAREFQRSLEDIAREAELDEVKKQIEQAGRFDPGRQIEKTLDPDGSLKRAFDPVSPSEPVSPSSTKSKGTSAPADSDGAKPAPAPATVDAPSERS